MAELIVALDYADSSFALALARQLAPLRPWMKVGLEMLMHTGPGVVQGLRSLGLPVFLDGKFHDIPNTVAGAVHGAILSGADMINVHASGGLRMMLAAREAAENTANETGVPRPLVIAVTVLTSISPEQLNDELGCARSADEQVVALALLAKEAGLDGVVASVWEAAYIKAVCGKDFLVVTPGIRPSGSNHDDQSRTATVSAALEAGADYLVIGRPITQADDPAAACAEFLEQIRR